MRAADYFGIFSFFYRLFWGIFFFSGFGSLSAKHKIYCAGAADNFGGGLGGYVCEGISCERTIKEKKMRKKNRFIYFILGLCLSVIFLQGCGLIAILGTEPSSEKKIPAEFTFIKDKEKDKNKKLLVLVNQPSWLNAPPLLRQAVTEQIQRRLIANAGLDVSNLVLYQALSEYRSKEANFSSMTAGQIGKALNADWVLIADLTGYKLVNIEDSDYYGGSLSGKAFLIDAASSEKLWPADLDNRIIEVGFEVEKSGGQTALARLAAAFAHCTTRFFYDCPRNKFKIAEDKSASAWSQWGD